MSALLVQTPRSVGIATQSASLVSCLQHSANNENTSLEERVTLLLLRDLIRLGWRLRTNLPGALELAPPTSYDKSVVQAAMAYSRNEVIKRDAAWLEKHLCLARANLATGEAALKSDIIPRIEICSTQRQNDLFRILRYSWSSPASDYVGRRMRFLIRDDGIDGSPVIGIAALGSSIIHIPARDKWIGWDTATRTERIIYMMDAYVVGAVPPYNDLLGGKLISYLLASNEVREMYKEKYISKETIIKGRSAADLALIVTTSLYGKNSAQYNRLRYGKSLLYRAIGTTSGYGSLHISSETFASMKELAEANGCILSNRFGDGPNWRMRVVRSACDILGLNSGIILKHSFPRGLFAVPLTVNFRAFLNGESEVPMYRNLPLSELTNHWRSRWLDMRKKNAAVVERISQFSPDKFTIEMSCVPPPE